MAKENPAHFDLVKQKNQINIRNILRQNSPLSIAGLASKASLTYPTVASLLKELENKGEVIQSKKLESRGGRPGVQYELDVRYQYGLVLYFEDDILVGKVFNVYGQVIEGYSTNVSYDFTVEAMVTFVATIHKQYPRITAISIGVPGVVWNNNILSVPRYTKIQGTQIYEKLKHTFQAEVFIENDLNAISLAEVKYHNTFAHIAYINQCFAAGIVLNGEVYTGSNGYAGELEYLYHDINEKEETLVTCILSLICVLNLPLIYISGDGITDKMALTIMDKLGKKLLAEQIPEIIVSEDLDSKYEEGLRKKILLYWENQIN